MKILQRRMKAWPHCWAFDVRLTRRRWFDYFLMVLLIFPYRCRACGRRFWIFVRGACCHQQQ